MFKLFRRIYALLMPDERRKAAKVLVSIFANSILEFLSLAALMPLLYYLLEGMKNAHAGMLFCGVALAAILLKGGTTLWLARFQSRFLLNLYKRMSLSLYGAYYRKGLLFIREQGPNKLVYEVNGYAFAFGQSLLAPMASMMSNTLLVTLVAGAVLFYAPMTGLLLAVSFLPFMIVYSWIIQKKVKAFGKVVMEAKRDQYKLVSETFNGFAELKVSGAYPMLRKKFVKGMDMISDTQMKMVTLSRVPMMLSEFAVVMGLTLLVLFGRGDVKILIGIFAVAAFRLLPAVRAILGGWASIQQAQVVLETLETGLVEETPEKVKKMKNLDFRKDIVVRNVTYGYSDGENVFENWNETIKKGEQVGFCGYSGAGKSTLFNLLLGLLTPDKGEVLIDGIPLNKGNQEAWLRKVGYVSQEVYLFDRSLLENIAIGDKEPDRIRVEKILKDVCLDEWVKTLKEGMDTIIGEGGCRVSGGQRQRIGLARALYRNIEVLMLDEATSALDDETEEEIMQTMVDMKNSYPGLTVLSIAHRKSSLAHCDRMVTIGENVKEGKK